MFDDEIPVGNARDLTDQVFGQLTILYRCKPPYTTRRAWWKCLCTCGKVIEAPAIILLLVTRFRADAIVLA